MKNVTFTFTGEEGTVEHLCEAGLQYCAEYLTECPADEVDRVAMELKQFSSQLETTS